MKVEQYVMAYGIEQDRVRAILPEGFNSVIAVFSGNLQMAMHMVSALERHCLLIRQRRNIFIQKKRL